MEAVRRSLAAAPSVASLHEHVHHASHLQRTPYAKHHIIGGLQPTLQHTKKCIEGAYQDTIDMNASRHAYGVIILYRHKLRHEKKWQHSRQHRATGGRALSACHAGARCFRNVFAIKNNNPQHVSPQCDDGKLQSSHG